MTPILSRTKIIYNPKVETRPNPLLFRLKGSTNTDINYWKQVLSKQDQNASKYIVIPSNWLVMPIVSIDPKSEDYKRALNGYLNYYKYLLDWALEYPWTSSKWYWEVWNKVILWHSSYWEKAEGRYKTQFQKIIWLNRGEKIWIYVKNNKWGYNMYKYIVTASYNTKPTDVSILKPWIWANLTLTTCTPIWGIKWRWVVKAKYEDENIKSLQKEVYFTDIPFSTKILIYEFISKIKSSINNVKERKIIFIKIYSKVNHILKKYSDNKKISRILEYLKFKLTENIIGNN